MANTTVHGLELLTSPEAEAEKVTEETSLCGTLKLEGISNDVAKEPNYKGKSQDQERTYYEVAPQSKRWLHLRRRVSTTCVMGVVGLVLAFVVVCMWTPVFFQMSAQPDRVRLSELEDIVKGLTEQLKHDQDKMAQQLTAQIATVHTELKVEDAKLTERISSYDSKTTTEHEKLASMYTEMMTNHTKTWGTLTDIQGKLSNGPVGAFSAYIDTTYTYSANQAVIFPKIIYNKAGCYNTRTGIFTAPVKAVYAFHIHIMEIGGQYTMSIKVKKGSTILGYVGTGYDTYGSGSSHETGSGTIITQMDEGEQLLLNAHYHSGSNFRLHGGTSNGYSSFSGYPVQPIV